MLNAQPYETGSIPSPGISRGLLIKLVVIAICATLTTSSIKTISLIYNTESETRLKEELQIQSYIELIKVKNEEKEVSSKQFIILQGRQIANLIKPGEKRIVVTNQHEVESTYQRIKSQLAESEFNNRDDQKNPWQAWFELFNSGL